MKICFLAGLYEPFIIGGTEIYVQELASRLAAKHQVTVVTSCNYTGMRSLLPSKSRVRNVDVYRFYPLNIFSSYQSFFKKALAFQLGWVIFKLWNVHVYCVTRGILARLKPDILHVQFSSSLSLAGISAATAMRFPTVCTLHDITNLSPKAPLVTEGKLREFLAAPILQAYSIVCWRMMRKVARFIAHSKFMLDTNMENKYFCNATFELFPCPACVTVGKSPAKSEKKVRLLYVGQINKFKGVHLLLQAFEEIKDTDVELHIVGTGPELATLKKLASRDPRIIFHGFVTRHALQDFYAEAHVVIIPSLWPEPFGMVAIEAFAFGTPVIASRSGGLNEIIQEGKNGFLFTPGDVTQLRQIIERLLRNRELIGRLGSNAINSAKRYDLDSHVRRIEALYETVLSEQPRPLSRADCI